MAIPPQTEELNYIADDYRIALGHGPGRVPQLLPLVPAGQEPRADPAPGGDTPRVVIEIRLPSNRKLPDELKKKIEEAQERIQAIVDALAARDPLLPPPELPRVDRTSELDNAYAQLISAVHRERDDVDEDIEKIRQQQPQVAAIATQLARNSDRAVAAIRTAVATFNTTLQTICDRHKDRYNRLTAAGTLQVTDAIDALLKDVEKTAKEALEEIRRLARDVDKITAEAAGTSERGEGTRPPGGRQPGSDVPPPGGRGDRQHTDIERNKFADRLPADEGPEDRGSEGEESNSLIEQLARLLQERQELQQLAGAQQASGGAVQAPASGGQQQNLLASLLPLVMMAPLMITPLLAPLLMAAQQQQQQERERERERDREREREREPRDLALADDRPRPDGKAQPLGAQPKGTETVNLGGAPVTASPEVASRRVLKL